MALAVAMALGLSGCGGGGGGNTRPTTPPAPPPSDTGFAGGPINVDANSTVVLPDNYSGAINLIKGGAGTLTLTGTSTYTGGTTISGGTLQLGNGGTTGSIAGNVSDNGLLVFNRGDDATFAGTISGTGALRQAGSGALILTGVNTYGGGTRIDRGSLQIGNGGNTGSITGNVIDNALLVFNRSDVVSFGGVISGTGAVTQAGAGTLILTGDNTYTGGTKISGGTLQLGDGGTSGSIVGGVVNQGTLAFNRSDDFSFANVISGSGGVVKLGNNALTLTGTNSYTGTTQVRAGALYVDGNQLGATGETIVYNGAMLGGTGTLGGNVTLNDGATLAPGDQGAMGTFTIGGNLSLSSGTKLAFGLSQAAGGAGDLVNVHGNLTLDGLLHIDGVSSGDLGPGVVRRLFNYDGTLLDNGLDLAADSPGFAVQTGVAHQVNLLNTQGMQLSFWDGNAGQGNNRIDGGSGTWQSGALSSNNWTGANGAVNAPFTDGSFAIFQAAPGTVSVDASQGDINVAGMQFVSDGYVIQGDPIHLVGSTANPSQSIIRVGVGDAGDAQVTATINSALEGSSALVKTDAGTLVLGGNNIYTGGTVIRGGILQIGRGGTSGSITGDVTNNASLVFNRSDSLTFGGAISGSGSLTQAGSGTLILTGASTYTGGTIVSNGILQMGNGGTSGSIRGDIVNNGYVDFNRADNIVFDGSISGAGALIKDGAGTLILTGRSTYDGTNTNSAATTINAGTLQIGNGGTSGSVTGNIRNNGSLVFNRSDDVIFSGYIRGSGSLTQAGSGTLILTGTSQFDGGTTISSGILQIGNGGGTGTLFGDVSNSGKLVFNYNSSPYITLAFAGTVSGTGSLIKEGDATLQLIGDSTYTGGTTINGGTLSIGNGGTTGSVLGNIADNGILKFNRSDSFVFGGNISGSGGLDKDGPYTLTLTGNNTYTGTTTISSGILQIGNGGATPMIPGNVVIDGYNSSLIINRSGDYAYGGTISGNGNVVKVGAGTMSMTGTQTFNGQFQVNEGTLDLASGASMNESVVVGGAGQNASLNVGMGAAVYQLVDVQDQGALFNRGSIVANGTAVWGFAPVTITNYQGGLIEGVVTQMGLDNAGVRLGANSVLTNYGTVRGYTGLSSDGVVNNIGGTISGLHSKGIDGNAVLINNTDGGYISAGPGQANLPIAQGVTSLASNAEINNLRGSTIVGQSRGVDLSYGGVLTNNGGSHISANVGVFISGAGGNTAVINNLGGSTITGATTGVMFAGGGKIVNGADATITATTPASGDCSTGASCAIYVPVYPYSGSSNSLDLTNAGMIVGNVQLNPGVANNVTLMAGGYIQGALRIGMNAQSNLTLDGDAGTTQFYSSAVSGGTTFGGSLAKTGAGTWILDTNDLQGVVDTSVNAGILSATQMLSGNVAVKAPGELDGVPGIAGNLINAGVVAVHGGDSSVGGDYSQSATGTLAISLGSKLAVSGAATLNGGTLRIIGAELGYVASTHTPVLTATGGLTGTFDQLVKSTGVVFTSTTINYDGKSAWLDTTGLNVTTAAAGNGVAYTPASLGSAQRVQATFTQLDNKIATNSLSTVSADFVSAAGEFQQAPTLQAAQTSLETLSGQLHAVSASMTFQAIDASSRALSDHFDDLLGNNGHVGMWTQSLSVGGDMSRSGYDGVGFQLNGWMVGSDRKIGSSGVAGFAFGQSQGLQRLELGYDQNRSRSTEGMLYAGWLNGNWYAQGRVAVGHVQQDVSRQLLLGTNVQSVSTTYSGDYSAAYGETGLHLGLAGTRITPFANVEYAGIRRDGFEEEGAGGFGLRAQAQFQDRWQAGLGLRAVHHWDLGGGRAIDFQASARFKRTFASQGDIFDASFVGLQQWQPLVGIGLSRYSGALNVSLDAKLSARTSMMFGYDYEQGQRDQAQMVSARMVMAF